MAAKRQKWQDGKERTYASWLVLKKRFFWIER